MSNYMLGKVRISGIRYDENTDGVSQDSTPELQDELVAFWSLTYPPWRRSRFYEIMHCVLNVSSDSIYSDMQC